MIGATTTPYFLAALLGGAGRKSSMSIVTDTGKDLIAGSLIINGQKIRFRGSIDDTQYGSLRDLVSAYGGNIVQENSIRSSYTVNVNGRTFYFDTDRLLRGAEKVVSIYEDGKKVGDLPISKVDDVNNPGWVKTVVGIQEFIDVVVAGNRNTSIKYYLGDVGGTWTNSDITKLGGTIQSIVVPGSLAKAYYDGEKDLGDFLPDGDFGFMGTPNTKSDFAVAALAELFSRRINRAIIMNNYNFINFTTLYEVSANTDDGLSYTLQFGYEDYVIGIDSDYLGIVGTDIGTFNIGVYK